MKRPVDAAEPANDGCRRPRVGAQMRSEERWIELKTVLRSSAANGYQVADVDGAALLCAPYAGAMRVLDIVERRHYGQGLGARPVMEPQ